MRSIMVHTFWMSTTSLVPRVMREAAEKRLMSPSEKATTWENSRRRTSRPMAAPVREATRETAASKTMAAAATPSISSPSCPR